MRREKVALATKYFALGSMQPLFLGRVAHCRALVLAGGGVRGLAFVGALRALADACGGDAWLGRLAHLVGASVGALVALLLALGGRLDELERDLCSLVAADLFDAPDLVALVTRVRLNAGDRLRMGMDRGDRLREWLAERVARRFPAEDPRAVSFAQLLRSTGKRLVVSVSRMDREPLIHAEYHSAAATPHRSVVESVACSMTLPLLFAPADDPAAPGARLFDGGVSDNLPFAAVDRGVPALGIRFAPVRPSGPCDSLLDFVWRLLSSTFASLDACALAVVLRERVFPPGGRSCVLTLDTSPVDTLQLVLSARERQWLLGCGRRAVHAAALLDWVLQATAATSPSAAPRRRVGRASPAAATAPPAGRGPRRRALPRPHPVS